MCTKPRKITNPTRFYYAGATKRELIVPCGHCDECRAMKAQDWHLRIWSEVKKYNELGGVCIFVTFTYKPECVPTFKFSDQDGEHSIPCFSKRDKNRFLNTMRKDQERKGFTGKDGLPLRYIWACEYGKGRRYLDNHGNFRVGTYAPHYHVILMLPPDLVSLLGFTSENQYKKYIQSFWPYGWCRWSKPISKGGCGIFVTNEFAGEYVSKYMCKDIGFFENPELKNFIYDSNHELIKENLDKMKDKLPTHWQSLQFGADLCQVYNNEDALIHGVDHHLVGDIKKGRSKKTRAPRYIRRKLLYEPDKQNQRYVLSEFGVKVAIKEFEETLCDRVDKIRFYFEQHGKSEVLTDSDIIEIFKDSPDNFTSLNQFRFWLREKLGNRDILDIYLYDMVWSGLFVEESQYIPLDGLTASEFMEASVNQYLLNNNKHFGEINGYVEEGFFKHGNDRSFFSSTPVVYYGSEFRFDGFDEILKYIHMCDSFVRARTNKQYLEDREKRLSMNSELLDHERRVSHLFGNGFHSPYIEGIEHPDLRKKSKDILSRIRSKGIFY